MATTTTIKNEGKKEKEHMIDVNRSTFPAKSNNLSSNITTTST